MYEFINKDHNLLSLNNYIYSKTLSMFDYENLPETLPAIELEKILQMNGWGFIHEVEGKVYAFKGTLSGEQDAYGNMKDLIISNVGLKYNKEVNIKSDGVLIKNDDMSNGLEPLINRVNSLLIENEITMYIDNYNSRIQTLLSAGDDSTKESAEKYLEKLKNGELGVIGENQVLEGIKAHNAKQGSQNTITQLIELNQYLKANLYNELGLNANFNMKRERLNSSEVALNDDAIHPFIDNMLKNREQAIEQVNEKYGLEISVKFGSIWERRETPVATEETEQEETSTGDDIGNVIDPINGVEVETLVLNITTNEVVDAIEEDGEPETEDDEEGDEDDDLQRMEEE